MSTSTAPEVASHGSQAASTSVLWRLFLVSTAALYLEIALIRWLGTEVKIFAFFQNLSLIVCFLGFGVGCFTAGKRGSVLPTLISVTALIALVNIPFAPWQMALKNLSSILSFTSDAALWGEKISFTGNGYWVDFIFSLAIVGAFLLLIAASMISLGRWVGYYLENARNVVSAYSINLLGSLVGIWLLAGLAFLWLSPAWWFAVAFTLIVLAQPLSWRLAGIACFLLAIVVLSLMPRGKDAVYWSPYQKLSLEALGDQNYQIDVNNEGYMSIANVTPAYLQAHPAFAATYQQSSYDSPFHFVQNVSRVLVVGSGAGNDIAAALRHGAGHVDAVEIDPLIARPSAASSTPNTPTPRPRCTSSTTTPATTCAAVPRSTASSSSASSTLTPSSPAIAMSASTTTSTPSSPSARPSSCSLPAAS
jgi:hypothetical protein